MRPKQSSGTCTPNNHAAPVSLREDCLDCADLAVVMSFSWQQSKCTQGPLRRGSVAAADAQRAINSSVKAPFPQPASSDLTFFGASTQSRNVSATRRLQQPISRSYASPSVKSLSELVIAIRSVQPARATHAISLGPTRIVSPHHGGLVLAMSGFVPRVTLLANVNNGPKLTLRTARCCCKSLLYFGPMSFAHLHIWSFAN
jgi:hypothetical protein